MSIILLDIDDFKKFNDTYGHQAGDDVLKEMGRIIKDNLRGSDEAFRYGGEEFVVIMPETLGSKACIVAERIRRSLKNNTFLLHDHKPVSLSASIGIAEYKPEEDLEDLVKRADLNMYTAKKNGKDQCFYSIK